VLRLRHALDGLSQASRAWNQRLETELRSRGFVQSDADPALWILHGETGTVLSMFNVDDGLVAARTDLLRLMHWSSWWPPSLRSGPSVSQRTFWASRSAGIMQPTPSSLPRKARPQLSQRSWGCLDAAEYCPCNQRCMQDRELLIPGSQWLTSSCISECSAACLTLHSARDLILPFQSLHLQPTLLHQRRSIMQLLWML
jgi:hypothetical protein